MVNSCKFCDGFGTIRDPRRKWWQLWKTIDCPKCGGEGYEPERKQIGSLPSPPPKHRS